MKKQIRIVKKGEDEGNLMYWLSLTKKAGRLQDLADAEQLQKLKDKLDKKEQ